MITEFFELKTFHFEEARVVDGLPPPEEYSPVREAILIRKTCKHVITTFCTMVDQKPWVQKKSTKSVASPPIVTIVTDSGLADFKEIAFLAKHAVFTELGISLVTILVKAMG
jgi:hypothetical protein